MLSSTAKTEIVLMKDEIVGNMHYIHLPKDTARELLKELGQLMEIKSVIERAASEVCFALELAEHEPERAKKAVEKMLLRMRETVA